MGVIATLQVMHVSRAALLDPGFKVTELRIVARVAGRRNGRNACRGKTRLPRQGGDPGGNGSSVHIYILLLAGSVGSQHLDDTHVLHQVCGYPMPLRQIGRRIVGDPDIAFWILPDEQFQGQIDSNASRRQHQGSAGLGITEDEQLGRKHFHADLLRFSAVVDQGKDRDPLCSKKFLRAAEGFLDGIIAGFIYESGSRHGGSVAFASIILEGRPRSAWNCSSGGPGTGRDRIA